jgi:hypothetical protein
MFFGYLRALLLWCLGAAALLAFGTLAGNGLQLNLPDGPVTLSRDVGFLAIGASVGLLVVIVVSYFVARPSHARREQLLNVVRQSGIQIQAARGERSV